MCLAIRFAVGRTIITGGGRNGYPQTRCRFEYFIKIGHRLGSPLTFGGPPADRDDGGFIVAVVKGGTELSDGRTLVTA